MAIQTEVPTELSGGMVKEIESTAVGLILDTLQKYQYQYPVRSTIRELVSNALDSIREKKIALSILRGEKKVEDYYVTNVNDPTCRDSKFNADYYEQDRLSTDDTVQIIYKEGGDVRKDCIIIQDHGVGLGDARLEGSFRLG